MTYEEKRAEIMNKADGDLHLQDEYECQKCRNKGYVYHVKDGEIVSARCDCLKIRKSIKLLKESGLQLFVNSKTFDNYEETYEWQKYIKEMAKRFISQNEIKWFFIGGQVGCVDCDTEYFNGTEWKKISEYKEGEYVLQYDDKTEKANLTLPYSYIVNPCEKLYHLFTDTKTVDMVLSDAHDFAYITSKGHMQKKSFIEVKKIHEETSQGFYGKIQTAFNFSGKGIELSENEIRLQVAVMADGSFKKGLKLCIINVKKDRKKERLRELLKGQKYKEYKKTNGYSEFRFYAPRREKQFNEYWYNCNNEQLKIIVDEVFKWDGTEKGKRRSFYSTSKKSADFIQFAISATGSRATISVDKRKEKECFTVIKSSYGSKIHICSSRSKNKAQIQTYIPKDSKEYCFKVETGFLVLRRNGRIFITGNCGKSHICTAMCSHFINEGKPTRYMLWTDVSKKLKANINEDTYAEIIQPYKDVEVLYIDDFFKVRKGQLPTNADVNIAFDILNTRLFSKEKVTIISSEFTLNKLLSVDEATISRIVENAKHFVVNLEEDSKKNYRFKK